ncbi:MAG: cell division protein FtsZ [Muribaculaceae bacterium]|nr:cell division protein FtsZ [Muribaculaceae bacterium]MDE6008313.1 cell division protein FtsZ [Muribaculaceae bacterium]
MDDNNEIYNLTGDPDFLDDPNASIIKVIGVGGGGSNAVNYMFHQDIPNVNFVVCNTDKQHLNEMQVPTKLLLGWNTTKGRGAGNNPEIGKQCAEESSENIKALFQDGTEMVFITAGMGGGTGTGAAPVVARLAKEAGMLTIGIVTVPFMFEGEKKILKALNGADSMREHVDALLVINNENLIELYPDYNFFNAFEKADDTLANAARSISDIISERCYINVDFQDVKTTLKDSGTAIISTAYGEGEHRISNAIHNALHSPLLKKHDINTSKRLLFKFTCSRESKNALRAEEIAEITEFTSKLPSSIDVKWGIGDNPELGDKVKITVLASGFDLTLREGEKDPAKATEKNRAAIVFESEPKHEAEKEEKAQSTERIADFYGSDKVIKQRRTAARMKYAILKPSQLDNHEVIALIESVPTFNRDPRFNEELSRLMNPDGFTSTHTPRSDERGGTTISFEGMIP